MSMPMCNALALVFTTVTSRLIGERPLPLGWPASARSLSNANLIVVRRRPDRDRADRRRHLNLLLCEAQRQMNAYRVAPSETPHLQVPAGGTNADDEPGGACHNRLANDCVSILRNERAYVQARAARAYIRAPDRRSNGRRSVRLGAEFGRSATRYSLSRADGCSDRRAARSSSSRSGRHPSTLAMACVFTNVSTVRDDSNRVGAEFRSNRVHCFVAHWSPRSSTARAQSKSNSRGAFVHNSSQDRPASFVHDLDPVACIDNVADFCPVMTRRAVAMDARSPTGRVAGSTATF